MLDFIRAYPPAEPVTGPAVWLPFTGSEMLVRRAGEEIVLMADDALTCPVPTLDTPLLLGTQKGVSYITCEMPLEAPLPDDCALLSLRALLGLLSEQDAALAGYASQVLYWRRTSGFCPVCGSQAVWKGGDWGRICTRCGHVAYPHISPAVLALVHDGPRILLVHKPEWKTMHSIVAGFVEPQESLEDCVRREVREEVGAEVTEIVYHGSQGWPFPHQLMVGFMARYTGGALTLDLTELDGAAWYDAAALPALPSSISLSRRLIDDWRASV